MLPSLDGHAVQWRFLYGIRPSATIYHQLYDGSEHSLCDS